MVSFVCPVPAQLRAWHTRLGTPQIAPFLALPFLCLYSPQSSYVFACRLPPAMLIQVLAREDLLAHSPMNHYGTMISAGKWTGGSRSEYHRSN